MKRIILILLVIFTFSCSGNRQLSKISYLNLKDSTRVDAEIDSKTLRSVMRQLKRTERADIKAEEKKSVTTSKNDLKKKQSEDKAGVKNNRTQVKVDKAGIKAEQENHESDNNVVIAKKKWLPDVLKWGSVFLLVVFAAFIYLRKKTTVLSKIKNAFAFISKLVKR